MPNIESTKFGEVIIDGRRYCQVLIIGDDVIERNEKKLERLFGTTHRIGDWEIEKLLETEPEIVIVGTGQNGVLKVSAEFMEKMQEANVKVIADISPEAIKKYNENRAKGKKINALIHTTC